MLPHPPIPENFCLRRLFLVCSGSSPPPWTPGTGLHRAMYGDDGLIERIKWWTQGSRDRIITSLVNLAKHFDVVKEVAVQLVDALGHGVDTPGHGVGPWDGVGGVAKRWAVSPCDQNASVNEPDFAENFTSLKRNGVKKRRHYSTRELQSDYWPSPTIGHDA